MATASAARWMVLSRASPAEPGREAWEAESLRPGAGFHRGGSRAEPLGFTEGGEQSPASSQHLPEPLLSLLKPNPCKELQGLGLDPMPGGHRARSERARARWGPPHCCSSPWGAFGAAWRGWDPEQGTWRALRAKSPSSPGQDGGRGGCRALHSPAGGRGRAGSGAGVGRAASEKRTLAKSCRERRGKGQRGPGSTRAAPDPERCPGHSGIGTSTHLCSRPHLLVQTVAMEGVWGPSERCKARGEIFGRCSAPRTGQKLRLGQSSASGAATGAGAALGSLQGRAEPASTPQSRSLPPLPRSSPHYLQPRG